MPNKRQRTAMLVDAMGGGVCAKHGEYIGTGKYHLKACPRCDIEEHYQASPQQPTANAGTEDEGGG